MNEGWHVIDDFDRWLLLLKKLHIPELRLAYAARGIARKKSIASDLLSNAEAVRVIDAVTVEERKLFDCVSREVNPFYVKAYGDNLDHDLASLKSDKANFNILRLNASRIQSRSFVTDFGFRASARKRILCNA